MKTLLLTIVTILMSMTSFGQNKSMLARIQTGMLMKNPYAQKFFVNKPLGSYGCCYYFLSSGASQYDFDLTGYGRGDELGKLTPDMKYSKVPIETKEGDKEMMTEFAFLVGGDIYVFFSFQNVKLKKHFLFYRKYDTETLKPSGELTKIAEISYKFDNKYKDRQFSYNISPDQSRILIYSSLYDNDGELKSLEFKVLDNKLETIWEVAEVASAMPAGIATIKEFCISDEGNVFILLNVFAGKDEYKDYRKKDLPNYEHYVVSVTNNGKEQEVTRLQLPGKFIRYLRMSPAGHLLILSGLCAEKGYTSVKGSCIFKLDSRDNSLILKDFSEFGTDLITAGWEEADKKKYKQDLAKGNEFEDYRYYMQPPRIRPDGGFWLIAEQGRHLIKSSYNASTKTYTPLDHYIRDDVYIVNYSPAGEILWTHKVQKHQELMSAGNNFISFGVHSIGNRLYFLYNDVTGRQTNLTGFKDFDIYLVSVDEEGKEDGGVLTSNESWEIDPAPRFIGAWGEDAIVLYGQGKMGYRHRFIKLIF